MHQYFKLSKFLTPIFVTPDESGNWFGYYNYDPLNHDQTKMLSNRTYNDAVPIVKGMQIEVGFYDISSEKWHHVGISDSFNWPQGCMAQWLPGEGNENQVIFNTSRNNHNIARIFDIQSGESRDIDWAIYGLTPDGKKSIAIDLERSHWCRAYHYESVANEELNVRVPDGDGIFEIDLINNTRKRIVSIHDIISMDKETYFDQAKHWLEHVMISPNGKKICFLHRFTIGKLSDYETRLFIADIDGTNLQIIDGWRNKYWSHFGWDSDNSFIIYTYKLKHRKVVLNNNSTFLINAKQTKFSPQSIVKKMYEKMPTSLRMKMSIILKRNNSYYEYYSCKDGRFQLNRVLAKREFEIDGHPSFTKDGQFMITDTYPNKRQYQHLILYDKLTQRVFILGKIFAALHNKPGSCDLHPKLSANNNFLVVDSAYNGHHHMILFKIEWDLIFKELKK